MLEIMIRSTIFKSAFSIKPSPLAGLPIEHNINPVWPAFDPSHLTIALLLPYFWLTSVMLRPRGIYPSSGERLWEKDALLRGLLRFILSLKIM
jgi:hypothetical protein